MSDLQRLATPQAARIGRINGRILKTVQFQEVIGKCCVSAKERIPKNHGDTVVFRRWLPAGATAASPNIMSANPQDYQLVEGETPQAKTMEAQDVTATLVEYGVLYRYSNRVADMYEDDVPAQMVKRVGQEMGLLLENVRYGKLKAGTNVFRAGFVAARSSITGKVSQNLFTTVARSFNRNLAQMMTEMLKPGPAIGTTSVEAAYVVVCSGDLEGDLRTLLPNFTHKSDYGTYAPIHPNEIGSWQQFRFVTSPHLLPYLNAGSTTTANTVLAGGIPNATGAETADVYPMIVMAEEAFGDVMLRGMEAMQARHQAPNVIDSGNPLGQRGHVGATTYFTAVRLNEFHMAVVEVACGSYST